MNRDTTRWPLAPYEPQQAPAPYTAQHGAPGAVHNAPKPAGGWLWRAVRTVGPPSIAPAAILVASFSASAGGAAHSAGDAVIAGLVAGGTSVLGVLLRRHHGLAATCLGVAAAAAEFGIGAYTTNPGLRIGWAVVAAVVAGSVRYLLGRGDTQRREQHSADLQHKQIEAATTITVEQVRADAAIERTRIKEDARTQREALRAQTAMALGYDPYAPQAGARWTSPALGASLRELLQISPEARAALGGDPTTAQLLAPAWGATKEPRLDPDPPGPAVSGNYL